MSPDGRFVTFSSFAHTLVPGDTNDAYDVFLRDRVAGTTERVSVSDTGAQGDADGSFGSSVSRDGRYVVFMSAADNLVEGDTNGSIDVFVRDRVAGTTRRVSVSSTGEQSDAPSSVSSTSVSASGRFVVFDSTASNLVPHDTNGTNDVFVRDTATGVTRRVSVSSTGRQARSFSNDSSISADGRMVAFASDASNLVAGDDNQQVDVFRRDRRTGRTRVVSVSSSGEQGDFFSRRPSLSAHGRYVAFQSQADNLVPGDTNVADDVFVRDVRDGTTSRVSVDSRGLEATPAYEFGEVGYEPAISRTGRFVVFSSHSDFLVPGDTNRWSDVFLRERTPAP
jgi:archaellum component FlaF (FlaF/FlaG flagellin family)